VRRRLITALAAALLALLPAVPAGAADHATTRVRVLTLNIFYGGDELDLATGEFCAEPDGCPETLGHLQRLIRSSGADVVGVQEPERNTERLAAALGWHGSNRAHVMSRFPLIDPPGSDGRYVYVEVAPGRVIAVANMHLPSDPYGPYAVRDGASREEVLALEREVRVPAARELIPVVRKLTRQGVPVVVTGDFNSPSMLDWTPAVVAVRPEVRYPVRWPASAALLDAGLSDTYREAHPDPVADPGFTWTPGGPETDPREVHDRIDWVLRAGPSRTVGSRVVGTGLGPYPTDHRGVVSTLDVRPAEPPNLVSPAARSVTIGRPLAVTYHAPPGAEVALRDGRGRTVASRPVVAADGSVRLATSGVTRGRYEVVLVSRAGAVLSRTPVWVYPSAEPTKVSTDRASYRTGQPIDVRFSNAPGMGLDWTALFPCDDEESYQVYAYTGSAIEGRLTIGPDAIEGYGTWPLPPGCYVAQLLPDDGLRPAATSEPFQIR
jgi:endonuclease/exonuclease/phosphatase family metal-dependent hydrolase